MDKETDDNVTCRQTDPSVVNHKGLRLLLVAAGGVCTALGVLGIFLPLLPTVPLLLLAAACFARGSRRCHSWLLDHRQLGPLVRAYLDGRGIPRRARWTAIGLIWLTIPLTVALTALPGWGKVLLLGIGVAITAYLLSLPEWPENT
jgi:hypothetical protein